MYRDGVNISARVRHIWLDYSLNFNRRAYVVCSLLGRTRLRLLPQGNVQKYSGEYITFRTESAIFV